MHRSLVHHPPPTQVTLCAPSIHLSFYVYWYNLYTYACTCMNDLIRAATDVALAWAANESSRIIENLRGFQSRAGREGGGRGEGGLKQPLFTRHTTAAAQSILHSSTSWCLWRSSFAFCWSWFLFSCVLFLSLSLCVLFLLLKTNGGRRGWADSPPLPCAIWWTYSVDDGDLFIYFVLFCFVFSSSSFMKRAYWWPNNRLILCLQLL